jgi:hypothetical protein
MLLSPVVLDVCDVSVLDGDELEHKRIASISVFSDPVDADDECALGGFNELVGAESGVAGSLCR